MSRIERDDVWKQAFKREVIAICPCCKITKIYKSKGSGPYGWNRGHIIADTDGGLDVLDNLRPLCIDCNRKDWRDFKSNYHYSAHLGVMSEREAESKYLQLKYLLNRIYANNSMTKCISPDCKGPFKRKANSFFCKVCGKRSNTNFLKYLNSLEDYYSKMHRETYNVYTDFNNLNEEDIDEMQGLQALLKSAVEESRTAAGKNTCFSW